MDSTKLVIWMIIACIIFMIVLTFSKPLKFFIKFIVQGVLYSCGFLVVNATLSSFNIFVGLNFLTAFVVGLLGFPGFVFLYIANYILWSIFRESY